MHDKKHVVLGGNNLFDQEMIDARITGLMSSNRPVPIDACLSTELAAYPPPPALFDSAGMMQVSNKSNLKTALQITASKQSVSAVDTHYSVPCVCTTVDHQLANWCTAVVERSSCRAVQL